LSLHKDTEVNEKSSKGILFNVEPSKSHTLDLGTYRLIALEGFYFNEYNGTSIALI
jgi:hypothetical protein